MRKSLAVALLMLIPVAAWAGDYGDKELTGSVGYMWGGTQEYGYAAAYPLGGSLHANASISYGGTLSFFARPGYAVEFAYHYQGTDLINRPNGQADNTLGDITTQYYMLQGLREMPGANAKVTPFVLGGLGMAGFNSFGLSKYFFAFDFGGGAKINVNEKVGLRLQARALVPVQWFSGGAYFGTGGSGVSVGGGTTLIQGDASIGLIIKLGS